jgi:hypothetical protein
VKSKVTNERKDSTREKGAPTAAQEALAASFVDIWASTLDGPELFDLSNEILTALLNSSYFLLRTWHLVRAALFLREYPKGERYPADRLEDVVDVPGVRRLCKIVVKG